MLEHEFHISSLIAARLRDELDPAGQEELERWVQASAVNKACFEGLNNEAQLKEKLDALNSPNSDAIWKKTLNQMESAATKNKRIHILRPASPWLRIVAAVILVVAGVSLFIFNQKQKSYPKPAVYGQDISAGANKATLTLANGEKISLADASNGELATQQGVEISKTSDGQLVYKVIGKGTSNQLAALNKVETPRGGKYQIILPDKSKVWLNAASSLSYPTNFSSRERKVEITGEAYFEVAHNSAKPFKVVSRGQIVEVLGTHFNINSYDDEENITTTLLVGSVRVTSGENAAILKPSEQSTLSHKGFEITLVNPKQVVAWKNGDFVFGNEDFRTVMRKVARWYDVEIIYDAQAPKHVKLGGWVSRSKSISAVLKVLESTGEVHFKVKGRRILVTR